MVVLLRVLVCFLVITCIPAYAGSFKVFPLKLTFDVKNKTALFRITNTGEEAVTVQLEGVKWFQNEKGEDQYEKARDIILFPKIVEVQKGEERVVRVAYRGQPSIRQEKSYRLFAQELPQKAETNSALSFALRFSVPVFVTASGTKPKAKIVDASVDEGHAQITVANNGSSHVIASQINLTGFSRQKKQVFRQETKGWYVLPKSRKVFSIALDEEQCRKTQWIKTEITAGRKKLKYQFDVDSTHCEKPLKSSEL